jgi:cytochrome c553
VAVTGAVLVLSIAGCTRPAPQNSTGQNSTAQPADNNTALDGKPVVYDMSYTKGPAPAVPVPAWAFAMDPPASADLKHRPDDNVPRHVPNSSLSFTRNAVLKHNDVIDWHPDNHPPAPAIVMNGRKPQPAACAFCHLPNGIGQPENAPLAGLPVKYFIRQVQDFRSGARKSADMRMASYHGMAEVIAPRIHNDELADAARYYAGFPLRRYLKVIETDTVPKTKSIGYTLLPVPEGGTEPIGQRIIETPQDVERFHLNDSDATTLIYVPVGSIARGRLLVTTGGNGKVPPCSTCHGAQLQGTDDIPPLAGRGPSNLVRQLYNFRVRARATSHAQLMYPVVANLTDRDIVDTVAYLSSLPPPPLPKP